MKIEEIWRMHKNAPFPSSIAGEALEGVDLVLLDADIAGCVSTYISSRGRLDHRGVEILQRCQEDLQKVLPRMEGETKEYFARLAKLGSCVLAGEDVEAPTRE